MEGFSRGRKLDKVGMDESDTAELFFENVRVPDANRLGEEGMGFISMMQRLPQERVGAAVSNVAHANAILEETIEYAKDRKAFGQPIGAFQHNKFQHGRARRRRSRSPRPTSTTASPPTPRAS